MQGGRSTAALLANLDFKKEKGTTMGLFDSLFGKKHAPVRPEAKQVSAEQGAVYAPVSGTVETTANIPDQVFASEMMGKTVAIWPDEGVVYAPVSGSVAADMPHAVGIAGDEVEILIHIGVDTVEMNGDGFTMWAKKGDVVKAGDALVSFDRDKIKAAGHPDIVMTIVTNSDDKSSVETVASGTVSVGDKIIQTQD